MIGLTPSEQEIVANLVYYHRKQIPAASDENLDSLPQKDRIIITKLCAILRVADALDTSHLGRIQDVVLEQNHAEHWRLRLVSDSGAMLERWALSKRKSLFQEVYSVKLDVT